MLCCVLLDDVGLCCVVLFLLCRVVLNCFELFWVVLCFVCALLRYGVVCGVLL